MPLGIYHVMIRGESSQSVGVALGNETDVHLIVIGNDNVSIVCIYMRGAA
jgi:hypothetical protein